MSRYRGSDLPRFVRKFKRQLTVLDVIHGRKVIVPRQVSPNGIVIEPGGIRRATNRFGKRINVPGGFTPEFRLPDGTVYGPRSNNA